MPCALIKPKIELRFDRRYRLLRNFSTVNVKYICREMSIMGIDPCLGCVQVKVLGSSCSDLATARTIDVFPDPERPVTRRPETK